jgi:hypothetical protein
MGSIVIGTACPTTCQEEHKANKTYRQFYRQLAFPEKAGVGGSTPSLATISKRAG